MKIAICCERDDAEGLVAKDFENSPYLLLIDSKKNVIYRVCEKVDPGNLAFADVIVEEDCEAVICGPIEKEAFEKLADAGVSRFEGSGRKAQRAYLYFLRNQLPLIRDYIGGPGPVGHSHDFSCEEREEGEALDKAIKKVQAQNPEREDTLFLLTEEEAQRLPDEIEAPDGLTREELEDWLAKHMGL